MNLDRFKNFEQDVRELVLDFEKQRESGGAYFDVEQIEVIADYYLEVYDVEGLESAVLLGEQLFPTSNEIRLRRAHLLGIQGQYPQALAILKRLERTEPDNTDVFYALATLYSLTNQGDKAISYYLKTASDGYQLDMVYGNIGDEYYRLGKTNEAISYYRKSIAINPDESRSLYNLACLWDHQGFDHKAQAFFSQLVSDHPFSKNGWYCLGIVYSWLSLFEKATDAFEYAIAIDKTFVQAYLGLSECYNHLGNTARAVQALRDSLDYTSDRPHVLYLIGHIYLQQCNYHTASTYYHDALKEDPSYSSAWDDLGYCSEMLGYIDEAAGYYRRAIDLEPDNDIHWLRLVRLYVRTQRYAEACALLESSRADATDRFAFDTNLLYCYYKLGHRNRLFALLREDAVEFGSLYPSLYSYYPEFSNDIEIVNYINSFKKPNTKSDAYE